MFEYVYPIMGRLTNEEDRLQEFHGRCQLEGSYVHLFGASIMN
jgi:hypothetical protein